MADAQSTPESPEPQTDLEWIDGIADRFEQAWVASPCPNIADFVPATDRARQMALLHELIKVDLEFRQKVGQKPALDAYLRSFPELREADEPAQAELTEYHARVSARLSSPPIALGRASRTLPTTIAKYRIVSELGRGSQATAYRAHDPELGRDVTLKLSNTSVANHPELREEILREGRALAGLQHDHLLPVHDCNVHEDHPYLVTGYIEGDSLQKKILLQAGARLPALETARIMAQVARAVAYIHSKNITHQDLKPANILIDHAGKAYVIDFGLARRSHYWTDPAKEPFGGTPAYLSPEQARGDQDQVGPASDIFSLGGVLYHLLTGQPPFSGGSLDSIRERIQKGDLDRSALKKPDIPAALAAICLRVLALDPAQRYRSADDLARDLERYQQRGRRQGFIAAGLALVAALFSLWFFYPQGPAADPPPARQQLIQLVERGSGKNSHIFTPQTPELLQRLAPLRQGDQLVLRCDIPRGSQATLLCLDTRGRWRVLEPCSVQDTDHHDQLRYPARGSWELEGPPGTLLLLVCIHRSEKPQLSDVTALVGETPRNWPALPREALLLLNTRTIEPVGEEIQRGSSEFVQVWDTLDDCRNKLRGKFDHIWGVALAQEMTAAQ